MKITKKQYRANVIANLVTVFDRSGNDFGNYPLGASRMTKSTICSMGGGWEKASFRPHAALLLLGASLGVFK